MKKKRPLQEEDLEVLDPLVRDLRHEIMNPLNVIGGHLDIERREPGSSSMLVDAGERQLEILEKFRESAEYVVSHTDLMGTLPESYIEDLEKYVRDDEFPEGMRDPANRIASVSKDFMNYQNRLLGEQEGESESLKHLLEPLERLAENRGDAERVFNYNGNENALTDVDSGMRILFWTLGKNWEQHSDESNGVYELGFDVTEKDEDYLVDVWNTGEGFFEQYPEHSTGHEQMRRGIAQKLLWNDDYGGHGLGMAYDISKVYDGDIRYTEEKLDDDLEGFGLEVRIPKYRDQKSTSESL